MRRTLHAIFVGLTLGSLALAVGFVVLWVRGYWVIDRYDVAGAGLHRFVSGGGVVAVESLTLVRDDGSFWPNVHVTPTSSVADYAAWQRSVLPMFADRPGWGRVPYSAGVLQQTVRGTASPPAAYPAIADVNSTMTRTFNNGDGSMVTHRLVGKRLSVPCWWGVLLAGWWPAVSIWRAVQRRRRRFLLTHCRGCGYDLRASPGRCPECGSAVWSTVITTGPELGSLVTRSRPTG